MPHMSNTAAIWTWIGIIFFVLIVIVTIHEIGHLLIAKSYGVRVSEFSIGFGPRLFSFTRDNTRYTVKLFLLGGYVAPLSDEVKEHIKELKKANLTEEEKRSIESKLYGFTIDEDYSKQKSIDSISPWRKLLFSSGGIIFNFLTILFVSIAINFGIGTQTLTNKSFISARNDHGQIVDVQVESVKYWKDNDETETLEKYSEYISLLDNPENFNTSKIPVSKLNEMLDVLRSHEDPEAPRIQFITHENDTELDHWFTPTYIEMGEFSSNKIIGEEYKHYNSFSAHQASSFAINPVIDEDGKIHKEKNKGKIVPWNKSASYILIELNDDKPGLLTLNSYSMLQESYFKADYGWTGLGNAITNSFVQLGDGFVNFADAVSFGSISRNYPQRSTYINSSHTQYWFHHILELISIYSALLIAFNILPIAPLDGWKMFENTREAITGKKYSIETTQKLNRIGQIIIWLFFIIAIFMPMLI